jgi:hypothetical protein
MTYQSYSSELTSILGGVLGALMPGASGGKPGSGQTGSGGSLFDPAILGFLQNNNPTPMDRPKAFENWLFLDEQFSYKQGNSIGADPIRESEAYPLHERSNNSGNALFAKQSGYVYIYTSKEM